MKKRLFSLLALLLLLGVSFSSVFAQTYRFQVPKVDVNYYINADGTGSVEYTIEFLNSPNADPIDFVDVGMPSKDFSLSGVVAEIDGTAITNIEVSEYIDQGIALGLGANAIPPGAAGIVYLWVPVIENVVYPSGSGGEAGYASFQFQPNYFGSEFVSGSTDMSVTLILPPGMTEDEPRYYNPQNWPGTNEPQAGMTQDGRVFYNWTSTDANSSARYTFGAGFPERLIPAAAVVKQPFISTEVLCCGAFGLGMVGLFALGIVGARKRKLAYLPPKIALEGHGIRRGLTAVEAGVLMQQPVDKILTMILFSSIKKGAASVVSRDPLKLKVASSLPEEIQPYEKDFLEAFKTEDQRVRRKKLQDVMVGLVKSVTEKMKAFSRKETIDYYENIMKQAWTMVEAANTPEVKSQKYDEVMDWTMLDKNYSDRTRDTFGSGPVILPRWWGRFDPTYSGSSSGGSGGTTLPGAQPSAGSGGSGGITLPTLPGSDFAASMVNGVERFSSNVIGDLTSFTGGISSITNPPPPPPKTSYRSGGGGSSGGRSCACACACAGCACACAGGGR